MTTLVTTALPYANGPLHVGHLVEYVLADVHVRYLRSEGERVIFLGADDTHGAPVEINALKEGVTPEEFVARWAASHLADYATFGISYDYYGSTNAPENRMWAERVFEKLRIGGSIVRKEIEQPIDATSGRSLSDRFIRGTCPNCGAPEQYGDGCENCNATYSPRELKDARSAISGAPLTWKKSEHLFFALSKYRDEIAQQLARPSFVDVASAAQLRQFFDKGLADWDVTRDGPYFGFPIPGETNKYFYVWLDAPIGYIGATEQWARATGGDALAHWMKDSPTRIVHVIGKDIVYFHCLFWPAMLRVAELKIPDRVQVHGHLTVNGAKMSKSRGSLIEAARFGAAVDPSALRFYFATLLGDGPEDLDLNLNEFTDRVNAELVNNLANLVHRTLSLLGRPPLSRTLAPADPVLGASLVNSALGRVAEVAQAFATFNLRAGMRAILEISAEANKFLTRHEPWKAMKSAPERAHRVLSEVAEVVAVLATLLEPVVPALSAKMWKQLGRAPVSFAELRAKSYPLLDRTVPVGEAVPLFARLEVATLATLLTEPGAKTPPSPPILATPGTVSFADFGKLVLRTGVVVSVVRTADGNRVDVDVGEAAVRRCQADATVELLVGDAVVIALNVGEQGRIMVAHDRQTHARAVSPGKVAPGSPVS